jgi:hypothetical protein
VRGLVVQEIPISFTEGVRIPWLRRTTVKYSGDETDESIDTWDGNQNHVPLVNI